MPRDLISNVTELCFWCYGANRATLIDLMFSYQIEAKGLWIDLVPPLLNILAFAIFFIIWILSLSTSATTSPTEQILQS